MLNYINSKNSIHLFLFGSFLLMNFFQPLIVDDLCTGAHAALYNHTLRQTLIDHYKGWMGRLSSVFLSSIFFNEPYDFLSVPVFNFINSIFLVFLYWYSYKIVSKNRYNFLYYLLFIALFTLFLLHSRFLGIAMWKSTAIQYLWPPVLILWFLQKEYFRSNFQEKNIIFSFLFGIFIALFNEIFFAFLMIIFVLTQFYYYFINKDDKGIISKDTYFFVSGILIGGIIVLIAPGNYVRMKVILADQKLTFLDKSMELIRSFSNFLDGGVASIFVLIGLLIIVLKICLVKKSEHKKIFLTFLTFSALLVGTILMYFPAMPYFTPRMLMLPELVFFILFLSTFTAFWQKYGFKKYIISDQIVKNILIGFNMFLFFIILKNYYHLDRFTADRMESVKKYQITQADIAVFDSFPGGVTRWIYYHDISTNPAAWENICFAKYYKLKEVKRIE